MVRRRIWTAKLYKELSNPIRLAIIERIDGGEVTREDIRKKVGVPAPSFSQHLQRLARAGVIQRTKKGGRESYYRLADPKILALNDAAEKIYRREPDK